MNLASIAKVESRCGGDARGMGMAQGSALREKIAGLGGLLRGLEAFRLEQPGWLPYPLFVRLAEGKAARALPPALREAAPQMLARMEGIAEGAGVPLRRICLANGMEAMLSSVAGRTSPAPGACSAVAVRGPRARSGEPLLARNFDYIPAVQPFFTMRENRPRNGFRSLEFTVAPLAGCMDGVNEKGLAITENYAFALDASRPGPLITMVVAEALATCGTVSEAADRIIGRPRWGAALLVLADASGDIASIELSNTKAALRRPAEGEDWLVVTNVCMCPETRAVQVPEGDVFSERVPRALRGQPVLGWHAERARRIRELVVNTEELGPEELALILSDHGPQGAPDGTSPCVHTDYWRTTASLQWFPARRSVRVSYGTACAAKWVELGL